MKSTIKTKIPKLHVRSGDEVKVLSGEDSGKRGRVLRVFPEMQKAIVEGVNVRTRHVKPNAQRPNGEKIEVERPVHVSKLMVIDSKTSLPSRFRKNRIEKGFERIFVCKSK